MVPEPRPPFATFLLPSLSLPFRRRQSSTTSTPSSPPSLSFSPRSSISTSPSSSPPTTYNILNPFSFIGPQKGLLSEALQSAPPPTTPKPGRLYRAQPNTLRCVTCSTDIAFASQIVSKGFTGRHGRAYLVGPPPPSHTTTTTDQNPPNGLLINTKIGRNVNRELLTGAHVVADVSCVICHSVLGWKYVDAKEAAQKYKVGKFILEMKRVVQGAAWEDEGGVEAGEVEREEDDDVVLFDDEDEDECEDLFSGVWDAEVVAKRRGRVGGNRR